MLSKQERQVGNDVPYGRMVLGLKGLKLWQCFGEGLQERDYIAGALVASHREFGQLWCFGRMSHVSLRMHSNRWTRLSMAA